MTFETVRYSVPGWGAGTLVLTGRRVAYHELPQGAEEGTGDHPLAVRIRQYFAGARDEFADVELALPDWTAFQRDLCDALRAVPYGEVVTYGELAALAGRPRAPRAAGTFCAGNQFGLFVPCHRVIAAGGIGSYGSLGTAYKRRLLELEGVAL